MQKLHVVTLESTDTARMGDLVYKNSKGGVIGPLLRKAVKQGLLTDECEVYVQRDGINVFLPCKASVFTGKSLKEDDKGLRHIKYVPYENPHYKQER